ncbi:hypothetical protein CAPTEDRAFT_228432 [Capitella teleta]|uniref:Uncharacterized protein n=1 Tax=Capitella teleta TaxID=283909 RepID=R7TZF3_CAPTE|nr:hypothetical protein CAPTEDRAFT_228432 [Capitella teleta]|eukprot:ELT99154.1 hypothetical protein CAPTEDRAFT_228432 [Capitella teleta]
MQYADLNQLSDSLRYCGKTRGGPAACDRSVLVGDCWDIIFLDKVKDPVVRSEVEPIYEVGDNGANGNRFILDTIYRVWALLIAMEARAANSSDQLPGNISIDVTIKGCFWSFDSVACIRLFNLGMKRHPTVQIYVVFIIAIMECLLIVIHSMMRRYVQVEFVIHYLKLAQLLLVNQVYWRMAALALRQEVVKFIFPIWVMTAIFRPVEMPPDQEDIPTAINEDWDYPSEFPPVRRHHRFPIFHGSNDLHADDASPILTPEGSSPIFVPNSRRTSHLTSITEEEN